MMVRVPPTKSDRAQPYAASASRSTSARGRVTGSARTAPATIRTTGRRLPALAPGGTMHPMSTIPSTRRVARPLTSPPPPHPLFGVAFLERTFQLRVVSIDVVEKEDATLLDRDGIVKYVHRHRRLQVDPVVVGAGRHRLDDALAIPAEDELRQGRRVCHAHAPVAQVAPGPHEMRLLRGVVQIDTEGIREDELEQAERVLRPRTLPQAAMVDLHVLVVQVVRIMRGARQDLLLGDARRDVPVRTEHEPAHLTMHHGRLR